MVDVLRTIGFLESPTLSSSLQANFMTPEVLEYGDRLSIIRRASTDHMGNNTTPEVLVSRQTHVVTVQCNSQ
jgi:hypothetical protein